MRNAFCDLGDHHDGTFTLTVRAQDVGLHLLYVKYEGVDVPGSPFNLHVSPASLVQASGAGLKDGVIHKKNVAMFVVQTNNAGPGDLKIRIGGPRGECGKFRGHDIDELQSKLITIRNPGIIHKWLNHLTLLKQ